MIDARPFLKWAGGKRSLLPTLLEHVPESFAAYHEPFVGGGALFFALRNAGRIPFKGVRRGRRAAYLNDYNERLVRTYRAVQGQRGLDLVEAVIQRLRRKKNDKEFFLRERAKKIDALEDVDVAAWMIYLNKTCFNGLYRVNRKNGFNTPFGAYANPAICDASNLRACAYALGGDEAGDRYVEIMSGDFENACARVAADDLVYFDPPYAPRSGDEFTAYHEEGFGEAEHERLRDVAKLMRLRGAKVMISNSGADLVRELYADQRYWKIHEVKGKRSIGATGDRRVHAPDVLIVSR